jgi:hypothetical protein
LGLKSEIITNKLFLKVVSFKDFNGFSISSPGEIEFTSFDYPFYGKTYLNGASIQYFCQAGVKNI